MLRRKKSRAERDLQVLAVTTELLLIATTVKKKQKTKKKLLYVSKTSPTILGLRAPACTLRRGNRCAGNIDQETPSLPPWI